MRNGKYLDGLIGAAEEVSFWCYQCAHPVIKARQFLNELHGLKIPHLATAQIQSEETAGLHVTAEIQETALLIKSVQGNDYIVTVKSHRSDWSITNFPTSLLERFSNECRNTKTKAIPLTNHRRRKQRNEPIRIWGQ